MAALNPSVKAKLQEEQAKKRIVWDGKSAENQWGVFIDLWTRHIELRLQGGEKNRQIADLQAQLAAVQAVAAETAETLAAAKFQLTEYEELHRAKLDEQYEAKGTAATAKLKTLSTKLAEKVKKLEDELAAVQGVSDDQFEARVGEEINKLCKQGVKDQENIDALQQRLDNVLCEAGKLKAEVKAERKQVKSERKQVKSELDKANAERDKANAERDEAKAELADVKVHAAQQTTNEQQKAQEKISEAEKMQQQLASKNEQLRKAEHTARDIVEDFDGIVDKSRELSTMLVELVKEFELCQNARNMEFEERNENMLELQRLQGLEQERSVVEQELMKCKEQLCLYKQDLDIEVRDARQVFSQYNILNNAIAHNAALNVQNTSAAMQASIERETVRRQCMVGQDAQSMVAQFAAQSEHAFNELTEQSAEPAEQSDAHQ